MLDEETLNTWNEQRIAFWDSIEKWMEDNNTNLPPWIVRCRYCNDAAIMCLADSFELGSTRISCCKLHVADAKRDVFPNNLKNEQDKS